MTETKIDPHYPPVDKRMINDAVEGDGTDSVADKVERNGIAWFGKHKLNVSYTTHLFLDSGAKVDSKIVVQNIDGIGRRQLRKSPV